MLIPTVSNFKDWEKEVAELEALIPEIKEKITDTNEMKAESLRKMREAVGFPAGKIIHCCTLHNAYIEQFGASVYKMQPYIILSNILLLSIIYG